MDKASSTGIPGFDAMNDTLGFVKKLWGGMSVPGMAAPTLSVDEINRKISDLKAVESWLGLNMSMLRSTIQALEVQSATISTIQSMGASLGAAMKPGADGAASPSLAGVPNPFAFFPWNPAATGAAPAAPSSASSPASSPTPASAPASPSQASAAPPAPAASNAAHGTETPAAAASAASGEQSKPAQPPDFADAIAAPTAWWNMLQGQFLQAVTKAMADAPAGASPASGDANGKQPDAGDKPAAKTTRRRKT